MECKQCGACCSLISIPLSMYESNEDTLRLVEFRGGCIIDGVIYFYLPCKFLNVEGKCTVHDWKNKPKRCGDFVPGCKECLDLRRAYFYLTSHLIKNN